jgi:hypothetical protein
MMTVQVFRKDGRPVEGARVNTYWNIVYGREGRTDRNGEVHLDQDARDCKILINGSTVHDGRAGGRMVFYI